MSESKDVARMDNPFALQRGDAQQGASAMVEQQRAVAEVLASMQMARTYPRDPVRAMDLILTDCTMPALAEDAVYDYARGGSGISGPSIRLAETIARRWGNIACGVKELGRRENYSEVMAYAIDLETGFRDEKTFQVRHWRDTKSGGYAIKDERDIYELIANNGARRKRACILAVIPQDVVDTAVKQCEVTMKAKIDITADFVNSLVESFGQIGVTQEMLEKRIQRKITALTPALAVQLRKIRVSLKDGMSQVQDWFEGVTAEARAQGQGASATQRAAETLAAARRGPAKADAPDEPAKKGPTPAEAQGDASDDASRRASAAAQHDEDETGEITNASVRRAIGAAGSQEALQPLMLDVMKLPADEARAETMRLWNARVMALKAGAGAPTAGPAKAAKVAPSDKGPGRPHGTAKVKAELLAAMNKAKDQDALNEAANQITLYGWDAADKEELEARYRQCNEDLSL